jgi:hypothetical protein
MGGTNFNEREIMELQDQLKTMRTLIHKMGWHEFMMHVGSLMAEQVDKVPEKQSSVLFQSSGFIHSLDSMWKDLGRFEYPSDMIDPL